MSPDVAPEYIGDLCSCGGALEELTSGPSGWAGRCSVYLVCEACGAEVLVGSDGVL